MSIKFVSVSAAVAAATAFSGTANAATVVDVDYTAAQTGSTFITIGNATSPQYSFGTVTDPTFGAKATLTGLGGSTVGSPFGGYSSSVTTGGLIGGDGDYGLRFKIGQDSFQGAATVDRNGTHISKISYAPAGAVPEPATWAMMMVGFGVAGAAMRRRRQGALATA